MPKIERKLIGEPEQYHGRTITVRRMGPDLLAYVDDVELPNFYLTAEAARIGGRKYIDQRRKEDEKRGQAAGTGAGQDR